MKLNILAEYKKIITLLDHSKTKKFLINFLNIMGIQNNNVDDIITYVKEFLNALFTNRDVDVSGNTETRTLYEWLIRSTDDETIYKHITGQLNLTVQFERKEEVSKILEAMNELNANYKKYFPAILSKTISQPVR